jgi:AmmeMemoRadiSam system protein B
MFPIGEEGAEGFVLRDPSGYADAVVLPHAAAFLTTMMFGRWTLEEIAREFQAQVGQPVAMADLQRLVTQLDDLHFLDSPAFAAYQHAQNLAYLNLTSRPAAHVGGAYHQDPAALRTQLGDLFIKDGGPGLLPWEGVNGSGDDGLSHANGQRLCGVMSPHIDFHRGGSTFAWAYDRVVTESRAKLFVILGTAHTPLKGFYSISRKDFETPLGTVKTDRDFISALAERLGESSTGVFADELPHRHEHSIEFQALMLQYVLGDRRDYRIVPILVGSFQPFIEHGRLPHESPDVAEFITALRDTAANWPVDVCLIAGVDMAHIGQRFGDEELLSDQRLEHQWADDQQLLAKACTGDSASWFRHVAEVQDANRICGLAPMYTLLETVQPHRGELLKYDQAVAPDRTSCVSFAAAAFYEEGRDALHDRPATS